MRTNLRYKIKHIELNKGNKRSRMLFFSFLFFVKYIQIRGSIISIPLILVKLANDPEIVASFHCLFIAP